MIIRIVSRRYIQPSNKSKVCSDGGYEIIIELDRPYSSANFLPQSLEVGRWLASSGLPEGVDIKFTNGSRLVYLYLCEYSIRRYFQHFSRQQIEGIISRLQPVSIGLQQSGVVRAQQGSGSIYSAAQQQPVLNDRLNKEQVMPIVVSAVIGFLLGKWL